MLISDTLDCYFYTKLGKMQNFDTLDNILVCYLLHLGGEFAQPVICQLAHRLVEKLLSRNSFTDLKDVKK